ncbi:MAG: hypothetical protein R3246_16550, partial [Acidimicrobiia bacterium]|nr:hypothetical protein [Acidimicrobiia bacterium]
MAGAGFDIGVSETPITPVMLGEADTAQEFSRRLFDEQQVFAQAITSLRFRNNKRSDRVTISCNGGFGAGCAQMSCTVRSPCDLGDRDGDGSSEMCLAGAQCYKDGDVCNSKDNNLGECYTEFVLSEITNPARRCECECDD